MFQESEMQSVLREIRKNDPNFERENFIEYAHSTLIPVALESFLSGDLESMKEWCSEPVCRILRLDIRPLFTPNFHGTVPCWTFVASEQSNKRFVLERWTSR